MYLKAAHSRKNEVTTSIINRTKLNAAKRGAYSNMMHITQETVQNATVLTGFSQNSTAKEQIWTVCNV